MITAFDDVLTTCLATRRPQRLLLLFVKAVPASGYDSYHIAGARFRPTLSLDKVVNGELRFRQLVAEADGIDSDWDFMLISTLGRRDGNLPSSEEAQGHLRERTREALESGDLSRFLVFDRRERPLWPEAERKLH